MLVAIVGAGVLVTGTGCGKSPEQEAYEEACGPLTPITRTQWLTTIPVGSEPFEFALKPNVKNCESYDGVTSQVEAAWLNGEQLKIIESSPFDVPEYLRESVETNYGSGPYWRWPWWDGIGSSFDRDTPGAPVRAVPRRTIAPFSIEPGEHTLRVRWLVEAWHERADMDENYFGGWIPPQPPDAQWTETRTIQLYGLGSVEEMVTLERVPDGTPPEWVTVAKNLVGLRDTESGERVLTFTLIVPDSWRGGPVPALVGDARVWVEGEAFDLLPLIGLEAVPGWGRVELTEPSRESGTGARVMFEGRPERVDIEVIPDLHRGAVVAQSGALIADPIFFRDVPVFYAGESPDPDDDDG